MRYSYIKREFPSSNPIANALVIVAGALIIGVSIVLGFFAFVALSVLVLVGAAVIAVRVWWFKRKLHGQGPPDGHAAGSKTGNGVIEGEFRVVQDGRDET